MSREELAGLVANIQRARSELDSVEAKAARAGTPQRLYESLSSLSNRPGGGVILLGLDEQSGFEVTGVGDAQRAQEEISQLAATEMEPVVRPEFTLADVGGKWVLAIEVPETPAAQKPCYYRPAGLQSGSYIRVGNTNRRMSDYEIFGYLSARTQPAFDEEPVPEATLDDLDQMQIQAYLDGLRRARPGAQYLRQDLKEVLRRLRVVRLHEAVLRPTLAGLLVFGAWPQEFEPQLVVTFLHYYGTTEAQSTPRGERFLDNRKFEGPIPALLEEATSYIVARVGKSSLIEGLYRRDIPEYPEEAVREALVNAVAHRDYSHYVRGSYVQVRLFADRLEIQSPGGLHGNVTEELLEEEQSTRNRLLMRFLEDLHLVENRGSGVRAMIEATRRLSLEPPRFTDRRSSFQVTFRNYTLLGSETVGWLNQFAGLRLNERQRLALAYLRANDRMTNSDYRRLNRTDPLVASRELRALAQAGLVSQYGAKRGAYYVLAVPSEAPVTPPMEEQVRLVIRYVRSHGTITNQECRHLLGLTKDQVSRFLGKLVEQGLLVRHGERRWTRYSVL